METGMKFDIARIDKNFLIESVYASQELDWLSVHEAPIELRGLAVHEGESFCRLPLELAEKSSEGIRYLAYNTAGGRVRFTLKRATRLAIRCESLNAFSMSHMPLSGISGVDIYIDGEFRQAIRPANDKGGYFEGETKIKSPSVQVEINLPLYNGIKNLFIGIEKGATIAAPRPYVVDDPVAFYGSSITQGGCASRPGNSYQGFVCRWLDCDHMNLGFSGNARGEEAIASYIASLRMSAFVMDYDHNAPTVEHLKNTHARFFEIIRQAQPDVPVIFISKPDCYNDPADSAKRVAVIRKTYTDAMDKGDKRVWFIDGASLFGANDRDACTVDRTHPNDIGFYRMAEAIAPVLRQALKASGRL